MKLDMFNVVADIANALVITLVMFTFLDKMYEPKYKQRYVYICACMGAIIVKVIISSINIPVANALYGVISINLFCLFLYNCRLKEVILYNFCYVLMVLFIDILTVVLFAIIGGETLNQILGNQMMMFFSSILNWILVVLAYKLLLYFLNKGEQSIIQTKEIIFLVYITIFEISIILYITSLISKHSSGIFLILLLLGFLLLNLYITRLMEQVARNAQFKYELGLARQQSIMQLTHFQEITKEQDLSRKVVHDVKKHINIIQELYSNRDSAAAKEYTKLLDNELNKLTYGFKCKNKIFSVILGSELRKAETLQIKLNLEIEDVEMCFIDDLDMTVIFANLIDNAIEACSRLDIKDRIVQIRLFRFNDFVVIKISNFVTKIPKSNGRIYETTKDGHKGIGLSNVIGSVEKYNGNFKAEILNNKFIVKIIIPIMNKV